MPWVRIDENAMDHPKIGGLSDGCFRLWVQGLAYCQKYLTDGHVSDVALRGLRAYSPKRRAALVASGLWEAGDGIKVHDYLQWNESREHVMHVRQLAKERIHKLRGKKAERACNGVTDGEHDANALRSASGGVVCSSQPDEFLLRKEGGVGETIRGPVPLPDARSKRPIFKGQRLVVFEWMLDDLGRMLGSHADAFDLHAWFYDLDAQVVESNTVLPMRDGGQWLQERTLAEAVRRGLPLARPLNQNPKTAGNVAAAQRFIARGQG